MDARGIDHGLLRRLQVRVGDRLEEHLGVRANQRQPSLSEEDVDALKAELAHQVVEEYAREQAETNPEVMSWEEQQDYIQALKNRIYGAGSLEALLRDPSIEEIDINGWEHVFVDYASGVRRRVPPVFSSNEELIETIQTLAAHEGLSGRAFDSANPHVNFRLRNRSCASGDVGNHGPGGLDPPTPAGAGLHTQRPGGLGLHGSDPRRLFRCCCPSKAQHHRGRGDDGRENGAVAGTGGRDRTRRTPHHHRACSNLAWRTIRKRTPMSSRWKNAFPTQRVRARSRCASCC